MSRAFQRLLHVGRRRPEPDRSATEGTAVDGGVSALEDELEPPPILQPAAIFRQYLYDPAEYTPVWARPRPSQAPAAAVEPVTTPEPAVAHAAPTDPPKPAKGARRQTANGSPNAARSRSKRSTKAKPGPDGGSTGTGGAGPT